MKPSAFDKAFRLFEAELLLLIYGDESDKGDSKAMKILV